jgi:hypothetical protein
MRKAELAMLNEKAEVLSRCLFREIGGEGTCRLPLPPLYPFTHLGDLCLRRILCYTAILRVARGRDTYKTRHITSFGAVPVHWMEPLCLTASRLARTHIPGRSTAFKNPGLVRYSRPHG